MDRTEIDHPLTDRASRLPWHRPQVERLTVNLDTREGQGSQQDSYVSTGAGG